MNNLVQLIHEEKWTEIPEFPIGNHNSSLCLIIDEVVRIKEEYSRMKEKLAIAEWTIEEFIKEELHGQLCSSCQEYLNKLNWEKH